MEFNYILNYLDNSKLSKAPQFPHKNYAILENDDSEANDVFVMSFFSVAIVIKLKISHWLFCKYSQLTL